MQQFWNCSTCVRLGKPLPISHFKNKQNEQNSITNFTNHYFGLRKWQWWTTEFMANILAEGNKLWKRGYSILDWYGSLLQRGQTAGVKR